MRSLCVILLAPSLLLAGQTLNSSNPDDLLRAGTDAQQRHDYKAAIKDFRNALAVQPGNLEARERLGESLSADGQFDAAIEEDLRVLAASPDRTAVRMNLALAYSGKGDLAHARAVLEATHEAKPGDLQVAVLLANTYIKMARYNDAVDLLTPLEPAHTTNMELEYSLAFAEIQSSRGDAGLPRMEKVARATRSANAWVIAGAVRLHRSEFEAAKSDLDEAMKLSPHLAGLNTMSGQARYALGDTKGALPFFQAALRANPRDFLANLYTGMYWLNQGDLKSAESLLGLALQLEPDFPLARLKMAELNSLKGNYPEALKTLEELEKADPGWLDPHVELAVLYYKLHRPADGQRERDIVAQIQARQQAAGPPKQ